MLCEIWFIELKSGVIKRPKTGLRLKQKTLAIMTYLGSLKIKGIFTCQQNCTYKEKPVWEFSELCRAVPKIDLKNMSKT